MWKSESRNHGRPTVMRRAAESRDIVGAGLAGIEVAAELAFQGARGIILHDFVRGARVGVDLSICRASTRAPGPKD